MVHAVRVTTATRSCRFAGHGFHTFDEFVAIVITNMHQMENGRSARRDHTGFDVVDDPRSHFSGPMYSDWFRQIARENPDLVRALRRVSESRCRFNPFLSLL